MKKIIMLMICMFLLVGCSNTNENNNQNDNNAINVNDTNNNENVSSDELKNPVIEWCQLYNPNGFNTVTCVISNPNDVDIDVSYDLVFYKDGKEVSRTEEKWDNFQVSPNHNDVIWGNYNIPSSTQADEVKMENVTVTKAYNNSINATISYYGLVGGNVIYSVINDTTPTINNVFVFEYNDDNNNKKCDKGELLVVTQKSITEKEGQVIINKDVYNANSYEIYYNAY